MTEYDDHDDAEQEAVRRLLADARHTEPMPADVVARMDAVLRGLAQDHDPVAPVVPLTPHRRRAAAALLAAAAAIVVGGVTFASLHHSGNGASETAGAAAPADAKAERGTDLSAQGSDAPGNYGNTGDGGSAGGGRSAPTASQDLAGMRPVKVRTHHFTNDALRAQGALKSTTYQSGAATKGCLVSDAGAGIRLPASYHGSRAVLVYRSPAGGSQVVDLYLCGARSPVRSTTLPQAP